MSQQNREYETVWHLVAALASLCVATPDGVVDKLTGYLWDAEEAKTIKDMGKLSPIVNCEYQNKDDKTCGHLKNYTPECHAYCCPRIIS